MPLRSADRQLGLTRSVAAGLSDGRRQGKVRHGLRDMLCQRVFGIVLGDEDLDDHDALRHDLALQTAADRDRALASAPMLCRFENAAEPSWAWAIHEGLVDVFIAAHGVAPAEIVLDEDATDDPVHGHREGRFFHGYCDHCCFLPLYVFCGEHVLVAYLRPADIDAATHSLGVLDLPVGRLRAAWPEVRIIVRADSGFCRRRPMNWCERNDVGHVPGLARNKRLSALAGPAMAEAAARNQASGAGQRRFAELRYGARSWGRARRVIARLAHADKGANPVDPLRGSTVVTNLAGDGAALSDGLCRARGEMENRIKEPLHLFADRTSCHDKWPNRFRLLPADMAHVLVVAVRRPGLAGTEPARARAATIRLRPFKIGAVIVRNTRRVRLHLSSACPDEDLFRLVAAGLDPG